MGHDLVAGLTLISCMENFETAMDGNLEASALCASISGYSSQGDSSRLINLLHVVRLRLQCNIWFLYVPSESNMSDWPSRGRLRDVLALGAREVRMVIPSLRLLLAPWAEVFDELDVISLV